MNDENSDPGAVARSRASNEDYEGGSYKTKSAQRLALDNATAIKAVALALIRDRWSEITTVFARWELCRRDQGYPSMLRGKMLRAIYKAQMLLGQPRLTVRQQAKMNTELVRYYKRAYCGGCGGRAHGETLH